MSTPSPPPDRTGNMRHTTLICQICSVPFSISRIRTSHEPESYNWDSRGFKIFEEDPSASLCSVFPKESGCMNVKVRGGDVLQHIAGQGCVFEAGYSGYRIAVEEMRGMGRCRYLVRKKPRDEGGVKEPEGGGVGHETNSNIDSTSQDKDGKEDLKSSDKVEEEKEEEEGPEYEKDSEWFITAPTTHLPLSDITKTLGRNKYGVSGSDFWAKNCPAYQSWPSWDESPIAANFTGIPVHSACWNIFEKISKQKLGRVDIDGFVALWARESCGNCGFQNLKQDPVIRECKKQFWVHKPGTEYLAANPVDVPGFRLMMMGVHKEEGPVGDGAFDDQNTPFRFRAANGGNATDPFQRLPSEIKNVVLDQLCSKDIASLRLASAWFRQLPKALFRRLIKDEMPWYWEIDDVKRAEEEYLGDAFQENYGADMLEVSGGIDPKVIAFVQARMDKKHLDTNWLQVYKQLRVIEKGTLGLRNRIRVYKVVEDIVGKLEKMCERAAFPGAVAGVDFPIYASWSGKIPGSGKSHYDCPRCE